MERNLSYEQSPEREKTEAELLMEAFENGTRFDNEDAKARDYNARLDQADEYSEEISQISEQINAVTTQLASLPLTVDQMKLLDELNELMAQRGLLDDLNEQLALDNTIEAKTKELASLPVTDEQGTLLDSILEMMDAREVISLKLQAIFQ